MAKKVHDDARETSDWVPEEFPRDDDPDQLRKAFRIVNEWSRFLKDWDMRVRAMCLIVQAQCELTDTQFESVVASVIMRGHDPLTIREMLRAQGSRAADFGGVGGAADVVGHPPDSPFAPDP